MADELPEIVAHNSLRFATLVSFTSEQLSFPARVVQDHRRFPRWKATSGADQILEYKLQNFLKNGTWDSSATGWIFDDGGSTATYGRQTSVVFAGSGSGEIDTTVSVAAPIIRSRDRFSLEKGKFYSISFVHRVDAAVATPGKMILYRADGVALETISDIPASGSWEAFHAEFEADQDYRGAYIEIEAPDEVATYYFDEVHLTEVRELDAAVFDGHNLVGATVLIDSRLTATGAWTNRHTFVVADILTALEKFSAAVKAPRWRIQFTNLSEAAELAILYLTDLFTLPQNPDGFDPTEDVATQREVTSEAGVTQHYFRYAKRGFNPSFSLIAESEFEQWFQMWIDIGRGRYPLFFRWRPAKRPEDIMYVGGIKMFRSPFSNGHLRTLSLAGKEILGQETPSFLR